MKIKIILYGFLLFSAAILFSAVTLHAKTHTSSLFWTASERNTNSNVITHAIANIKRLCLNQTDSSNISPMITTLMNDLKPVSSPVILSTSLDGDITRNNTSNGKVASAPEPVTLLLLGTGLMGVALYRRLKNK